MIERRYPIMSLIGRAGAYLFIVCLYTSPGDFIPASAPLHPALLSAFAMLSAVGWTRLLNGVPLRFAGGIGWAMGLLFAFAGLSALWAIDSSLAVGFSIGGVKLMLTFVGIATMLRDPLHVRTAMFVAVLASMIPAYGTISRYRAGIGLVEGYRGSWIGLLANPNQLAMVMVVTVPWAMLLINGASLPRKAILLSAMGLQLGAIVATHSRGGSLGLAAAMILTAFLAQNKARAIGILAIAGVGLVILAPRTFWARTETIQAYAQDASAQGRIESWRTGFRALEESPLLGIGADNYVLAWDTFAHRNVREKSYAAHNMWMQVLVELGLIGIGLFAAMFWLILRGLWRVRGHAEAGGPARALLASLLALIVCGTTGGYAFNWFFYMVLGLAGAIIGFVRALPDPTSEVLPHGVAVSVA